MEVGEEELMTTGLAMVRRATRMHCCGLVKRARWALGASRATRALQVNAGWVIVRDVSLSLAFDVGGVARGARSHVVAFKMPYNEVTNQILMNSAATAGGIQLGPPRFTHSLHPTQVDP